LTLKLNFANLSNGNQRFQIQTPANASVVAKTIPYQMECDIAIDLLSQDSIVIQM
jgi:hypothetical protein